MIASGELFRAWIEHRLGMQLASDAVFIGKVQESGEIVAVCAFSHYTGHDIELSVAAEAGGGSKDLLAIIFGYVFDQAGCARCTVRMRESNTKAIKLARRLGFEPEGKLRNGFGDEAALLFGLLRNEYHGKRRRKATSGTRSGTDHPAAIAVQPIQHDEPLRVVDVVDG